MNNEINKSPKQRYIIINKIHDISEMLRLNCLCIMHNFSITWIKHTFVHFIWGPKHCYNQSITDYDLNPWPFNQEINSSLPVSWDCTGHQIYFHISQFCLWPSPDLLKQKIFFLFQFVIIVGSMIPISRISWHKQAHMGKLSHPLQSCCKGIINPETKV